MHYEPSTGVTFVYKVKSVTLTRLSHDFIVHFVHKRKIVCLTVKIKLTFINEIRSFSATSNYIYLRFAHQKINR